MDLDALVTLLDQYGIPMVVIALLTWAVSWLLKRLLKVLDERIKRAEDLVDKFKPSIDSLTEAVEEQTAAIRTESAVMSALLEERKGRS